MPSQAQVGLLKGLQGFGEGFGASRANQQAQNQKRMMQEALDARKRERDALKFEQESIPNSLLSKKWLAQTGTELPEGGRLPASLASALLGAGSREKIAQMTQDNKKPAWKPFDPGAAYRSGLSAASGAVRDQFGQVGPYEEIVGPERDTFNQAFMNILAGEMEKYRQQPGAPPLNYKIKPALEMATGGKSGFLGMGSQPERSRIAVQDWVDALTNAAPPAGAPLGADGKPLY